MSHEFDGRAKAMIKRDDQGSVRDVLHVEEPFESQSGSAMLAAREYLDLHGALLGIATPELANFSLAAEATPIKAGVEYRFHQDKPQFDTTTVVFEQTYFGLPVWQAALTVHMQGRQPYVVTSAQSSRHASVDADMPSDKALQRAAKLDDKTLVRSLGVDQDPHCEAASLKVLRQRLVVYRYAQAQRLLSEPHAEPATQRPTTHLHPTLKLPPPNDKLSEGRHYVALELTFSLTWRGIDAVPWLVLLELETLSPLYLRAFIDDVNGLVFESDPITLNNGPLPGATAAQLNALRSTVQLVDIAPPVAGTVSLTGEHVTVTDIEVPNVVPPTRPAGSAFDFGARTDNFSAVNAYYHCNRFFDLVADLGFDLPTYFTGTLFPSTVDHRGRYGSVNGLEINAYCMGNGAFGIGRTAFMLADLGDTMNPMGLACDWRVVLHELGGHGILYNHVNSANFGFAHSAGDSFAAVLNDPDTRAADRFQTFPWVYSVINRRHDRDVTTGWAWGGTNDFGSYSSEQILCTTHFRLYRSVGGDAAELAQRRYASRYVAYLMLRTIGSLTQPSNPNDPEVYAGVMLAAERGDWASEDHVGGVYGKVVRWAFEKQGAYQPPGAPLPVVTEGAPPPVDLYIDDGRHGEYGFQERFWETGDVWNRLEPDGQASHQTPRVCCVNHAYVRVKNRGMQTAKAARVHAFRARPGAGLVWPDDFEAMSTASLSVPDLAPGAEAVVGPFAWTPVQASHEVMLMSVTASGDRANNDRLSGLSAARGPTPAWRLVPADNNIALRALVPVPGGGGRCALEAAFCNRRFWAQNPFGRTARIEIKATMPPLLASRGWVMRFDNPGGANFTLGPRGERELRPVLVSGRDFEPIDVVDSGAATVVVRVLANGIVVGGVSFRLDPAMTEPVRERQPCCGKEAEPCKESPAHPGKALRRERCCCEPCVDDRCLPRCCSPCCDEPEAPKRPCVDERPPCPDDAPPPKPAPC